MKDYNCPTCKKMIPVDLSQIKAGDAVSFCKKTTTKRTARFSTKQGVIESRAGDVVIVKYKNESLPMHISDVTPADAPSPLAYGFCGVCECPTDTNPPKEIVCCECSEPFTFKKGFTTDDTCERCVREYVTSHCDY